jgi:PAS domain S-box-containing protein
LNALSAHIALIDPDGVIITVNEAWREFATANELQGPEFGIGQNYLEICESAGKTSLNEILTVANGIRRVLRGEAQDFSIEYPCHTLGEQRWFQLLVTPLREHQQAGAVVMHIDITKRKQAEQALRESENKFSKMFQSSPMAMALSTVDEGRYLDANKEFLKMLERSRDEVIGHTAVELGVWAEPEQRTANILKLKKHGSVRNVELEIRGKSGHVTPILWSAEPLVIGGESCLLGSSLDITERKQVKDELLWKTAFLEAQVDSALDGILVVDSQGKRILRNQRLNELWKYPPEIVDSRDNTVQVEFAASRTKNPREFAEKIAYLYAHPDEVSRDEIELVDGTVLDRYSSPVRDKAGKHYGRIWAFRDITERRNLEAQFRQAQKMEAVGRLAGGVAHDFNNILAVIQMQAGLLTTSGGLSPEQAEYADGIGAAAQRATALTRQLLLFSRKEIVPAARSGFEASPSTTSPTCCGASSAKTFKSQFKFAMQPLFIYADAGMIDQVLMNLAVNSRDAMPRGGKLVIETSAVTNSMKRLPPIPPRSGPANSSA